MCAGHMNGAQETSSFHVREHSHKQIYKYVRDFRLRPRKGENWALLGYYAASSGNLLPTFRDNISVPFFLILDP